MKTSSNYGLKLMEGTDNVRRQDFVDNFTKIDTEMRVIENGGYPIVEATGTNSYTGSTARIKTLTKGTKLTLFVGADATGNCSLNLNGYGAKSIKDSNKNIVKNLKANVPYNLCYNGSDFILQGKGGGGNLIPKYLLAGYYGEGDNGRVDGAMVNRGAPTTVLNCGGTYNLQEGYYSGGKIQVNSLASQTPGNATTEQILAGYFAWVNGVKVNGSATIQSLGGKYFASGTVASSNVKLNSTDGKPTQAYIDLSSELDFEPTLVVGLCVIKSSYMTTELFFCSTKLLSSTGKTMLVRKVYGTTSDDDYGVTNSYYNMSKSKIIVNTGTGNGNYASQGDVTWYAFG